MALMETESAQSKGRGERGEQQWVFCSVPKAPWPINRLFEFPPWRACHVSIRQGLFLLPVRLLAAGGSHTSHLAVHMLSGARQTVLHLCVLVPVYVRACARARACVQRCTVKFMSSGYSFL